MYKRQILLGRLGGPLGDFTAEEAEKQRRFFKELNAHPFKILWSTEPSPGEAIEVCMGMHSWTVEEWLASFNRGSFHKGVVLDLKTSDEPPPMPMQTAQHSFRRVQFRFGYSQAHLKETLRLLRADGGSVRFVNPQLPTLSNRPQIWVVFGYPIDARQFDCRVRAGLYPPMVKEVKVWDGEPPEFVATEEVLLRVEWEDDDAGQWLTFVEAAELFGVGVAMQSAQMNCDDPSRPGAPRLRMSALRDLSDADFHHRLVAIQGKIGATVCMWCNNEWVKANDLP